jgi:hypothetical protein
MNKIVKKVNSNGELVYTLVTEDNQMFDCTRLFEKKTNVWHIKLPKDNPSGRTFIRESILADKDEYLFETKTTHRTGLTGSGGWRSKLTPDEAKELQKAEETIAKLKKIASERKAEKLDPNSVEGIEAAIAKLMEKLAAVKAK